ncbi:MAG TPA: hypothetical protein VMG99_02305 [Thermoplasmata archaeon]|nr:hypothetical protein [Thermoplasmata archaeon]
MVGPLFWAAVAIGAVVALLAAYWGLWAARAKRRTGTASLVQRARLTCPKCGQTFDYDFVPGAAVTAIRLGSSRYLRCPRCGKWSTFDLVHHLEPPGPTLPPGSA